MKDNIFLPRLNNLSKDSINEWLHVLYRFFFIAVFSLLPVFFIPSVGTSLGFTKTYLIVIGISIVSVLLTLSVLRRGLVKFTLPLPLTFFWIFTFLALASALLSGDKLDAIYGNNLEVQTAGFFVLMAVVITVSMVVGKSKSVFAKLLVFFGLSSLVLLTIHFFRLFFGADFLSFGMFTQNTSSVIGSFNDLALFSGLVTIVSLILLQGSTLRLIGKILLTSIITLSLVILAVVNFSFVWYVLGGFSLLMLLYLLSKDTWLSDVENKTPLPIFSLSLVALVVVFSVIFSIGGNNLGAKISGATGINYLEVRPSTEATFDIVKSVYSDNALFGVGPNRFEDAWRLHKDSIINQTYFWNTDFTAGSGFVPTLFATTGLAGSVFIILFLLAFLYSGFKTLLVEKIERSWYLIGVVTFVSAVYLWLMAIFYVPGPVIVLLTALMTGLFLSVYVANNLNRTFTLNVIENKHYGFVLITLVLAVVISTTTLVLKVSEQYLSQVSYAKSLLSANSSSLAEFDENLQASEYLFAQDIFTAERARLRLAELNRLVAIAEPTDLDRQVFQNNLIEGITLSEKAITLDPTNPFNHALLASFYGLLNVEQSPEVKSRRDNELAQVKLLDPKNPSYLVLFAQLSAKQGDLVTARSHLNEALNLKNDYTDALLLLSQIDLEEGKIESAIKVTNSIITLEPNNPARYFQLGVLLAKNNNLDQSVLAFKEAIRLDNSYANARYFLALAYLDLNKKEEALVELKNVLITNPDNQEIKNLISRVESGEFTKVDSSLAVPVDDVSVVDKKEDVTTATETPDTDLVTPLNQNNNAPQIEDKSKTESISADADTVTE